MTRALLLAAAILGGCGDSSADPVDTSDTPNERGESDTPSERGEPEGGCEGTVVVALYQNDQCEPGTELLEIALDLTETCVGWERVNSSGGITENSATRFQCYQDRLCFTQYPGNLVCDGATLAPTDKAAHTDTCTKDPTPSSNLHIKVLSGTEDCPPAPDGFECPESEAGLGTTGLAAACE